MNNNKIVQIGYTFINTGKFYYYYYYYYKSMCLEWHCHISCCRTTVPKYKNSIKYDKNV